MVRGDLVLAGLHGERARRPASQASAQNGLIRATETGEAGIEQAEGRLGGAGRRPGRRPGRGCRVGMQDERTLAATAASGPPVSSSIVIGAPAGTAGRSGTATRWRIGRGQGDRQAGESGGFGQERAGREDDDRRRDAAAGGLDGFDPVAD